MSHLWNLVKKELKELLTPSSLISVLVIVIMFVALGSFIGGEVENETSLKATGIVDLSQDTGEGDYSDIGIEALKSYYLSQKGFKAEEIDKYVVIITITDAELGTDAFNRKLCDAMKSKELETALVIPSDFETKLNNNTQSPIYTYWNQTNTSVFSSISTITATTSLAVINSGISTQLMSEKGVPQDKIAFLKQPCTSSTSSMTTFFNGQAHNSVTPTDIYSALNKQTMFIPIIIMLIIVMIGSIVISSMGNEKENKTLETLLTLPVSRMTIVAGKLVGSAIAGLLMGAMYMIGMFFYINGLTGKLTSGVSIESLGLSLSFIDWIIVALFLFISILCALGLCMILGAFAKNTKTAQMYILPISVLAMIPMFVTMFADIGSLPTAFQAIMFLIPFSHPMTVIQNLMFGNTAIVAAGAVYLIVFAAVTMLITVKIYNSDILLTGLIRKKSKKMKNDEQPE